MGVRIASMGGKLVESVDGGDWRPVTAGTVARMTKAIGQVPSTPMPDSPVDALPGVRSWDSLSDAEKDAIRDKEDRERWLSESPSLPEAVEMLSERKPLANLEREGMLCYYCDKPADGLLDSVLICRRCRE